MHFPIGLNASWLPPESTPLTPALSQWLLDPGSLTAKLKQVHASFRVEVLVQQEQLAEAHEYQTLGLIPEIVTVREVLLYSNEVPWVFARSILPHRQLAHHAEMTHMGSNPLGEHLFQRDDIAPGTIEIAEFSNTTPVALFNTELHQTSENLWGRRRLFHLPETAILVAEVFLSPVPCYANSNENRR